MRNFLLLLRLHFKSLILSTGQINTKNRKKAITGVGVLLLFSGVMLYFGGFYSFMIAKALVKFNLLNHMITFMLTLSIFLCFFTSMFKAEGFLYSTKDSDLLMSLPVGHFSVMMSKVSSLYLENLFFSFFILMPTAAAYMYFGNPASYFIPVMLLIIFLIPFIPTVLCIIVGFIISYIASKTRFKNLINFLLYAVFLALVFYLSFSIQGFLSSPQAKTLTIAGTLEKYFPIPIWATNALTKGNFVQLGLFALSGILPLLFVVYVFSFSYKTILSGMSATGLKRNYKLKDVKTSGLFFTLFKKECEKFIRSPMYIINTAFGAIVMFASAIVSLFYGTEKIEQLLDIPGFFSVAPKLVLIMFCAVTAMSCTTSPSISLEGKNLWILKSAPVERIKIFYAKILLNMVIVVIPIIISSIVFAVQYSFSFTDFLIALILPSIYCIIIAMLGLIINLYFPKLEFSNETVVVKQSMSVLLTMGAGVVLVGGTVALYYITKTFLSYYLFIGCITIFAIAITYLLNIVLKTKGVKLFNSL